MMKNYFDARNWLENFIPYTYSKKNLGLARIRHLLKLLGNPQDKFKSIHVAGTSGKGSTAYYIARLLQCSKFQISNFKFQINQEKRKLKVGLHVSPHLVDVRERMQINGQMIPMKRFVRLMNEVKESVDSMKDTKIGSPSYFEILVAASFKYFAEEKVDWAVVEVGLGGRLDATNVLQSRIAVITNIGLDHTDILGSTIEKIAYEKAGIIKDVTKVSNGPKVSKVVTGARGKALKVIEKVARLESAQVIRVKFDNESGPRRSKNNKAELIKVNTQEGTIRLNSDIQGNVINYYDIDGYIGRSFVSPNFMLALTAISALGLTVDRGTLNQVADSDLPGRLEEVEENVILDGAHNIDKIQFLIESLRHWPLAIGHSKRAKGKGPKAKGIVLVLSFKKGKDWKKMVDLLIKNLPVKKVIATEFYQATDTGFFASVDAREIADYILSIVNRRSTIVEVISNSQEAVFEALRQVRQASSQSRSSTILVTGSLYLIGEARTMWILPSFA